MATTVHCQAEEKVAPGCVALPPARVPHVARQVVARIEHLAQRDAPEPRNSEQGGRFHLDRQASFSHSPVDLATRLAVVRVGRPGHARQEGHAVAFERSRDGLDGVCGRFDQARRRRVVVARPDRKSVV